MLLIKQTVQHATESRSVALNGPLVRLGTFSDIQNSSARKEDQAVSVGFGWKLTREEMLEGVTPWTSRFTSNQIQEIEVEFEFDNVGRSSETETLELQPSLKISNITALYQDQELADHAFRFAVQRASRRGRRIKYDSSNLEEGFDPFGLLVKDLDEETRAKILEKWPDTKIVGAFATHFMPSGVVVRFDRNRDIAMRLRNELGAARASYRRRVPLPSIDLPPSVMDLLSECIRNVSAADDRAVEIEQALLATDDKKVLTFSELLQRLIALPSSTRLAVQRAISREAARFEELFYSALGRNHQLTRTRGELMMEVPVLSSDFFRFGVRYLGPLRDEPRPLYPLQAMASPTDVGPKGELTAAVLHLNSRRKVEYVPPTGFQEDSADLTPRRTRLIDAVSEWLRYLGVAVALETSEKGKFGHELRVKTSSDVEFQDLTNVGVGVSQVLPIVVTCLLAPKGSTIILEQPELHLHPAVQARLADFFISMSVLSKQCIIETHGEHLIDRLRLRVVCDESDKILHSSKIFFFSQRSGVTTFREVVVNEYGAIEDWPDDFFDQSQKQSEQITLKALTRRRLARERAKVARG
jgi:predicted ATPase